jgi:hypothetical protein
MSHGASELFDPQDPGLVANPYPAYARLRAEAPILRLEGDDMWIVTRYADVMHVLRTPDIYSSMLGMAPDVSKCPVAETGINYRIGAPGVRILVATDPPDHTILRRAVSAAFSPGALRLLMPKIDAISRDLVGNLLERNESNDADFFRDVAEPMPVQVLAQLFGVPSEMGDEFREWSRIVTSDLASGGNNQGIGRGLEMFRYFRQELQNRRRTEATDLLGVLATASPALSEHEILSFCALLLVAGIETTTNLLANLLCALLGAPDQQSLLRRQPGLLDSAIEEGLRYDSPVQALWRATTCATDLGGVELPPSARLLVVFASANRDERQFERPDVFRVDRTPNDHLGFGAGSHYCLGARLARAEVRFVMNALLEATQIIFEREAPERTQSLILRGFVRQPVTVRAS